MSEIQITCIDIDKSVLQEIDNCANKFKLFDKKIKVVAENKDEFKEHIDPDNYHLYIVNFETVGSEFIHQVIEKNNKGFIKILIDYSNPVDTYIDLFEHDCILGFIDTKNISSPACSTVLFYSLKKFIEESDKEKSLLKEENQRLHNIIDHDIKSFMEQILSKQMNPHFIFNSLNSIQRFILENDRIKSSTYLSKFAMLMRIVLNNSQHNLVLIQDDVEALQLYLELESLRFENKFTYQINIDNPSIKSYKIPPLLIQPFVENSIWHGLMPKKDPGNISISFFEEDNKVKVVIKDNGIGRKAAELFRKNKIKTYKSMGSSITERRLNLINTLYNSQMDFKYIDLEDDRGMPLGTEVNLNIPKIIEK
jgi:hypothetical protein